MMRPGMWVLSGLSLGLLAVLAVELAPVGPQRLTGGELRRAERPDVRRLVRRRVPLLVRHDEQDVRASHW